MDLKHILKFIYYLLFIKLYDHLSFSLQVVCHANANCLLEFSEEFMRIFVRTLSRRFNSEEYPFGFIYIATVQLLSFKPINIYYR